MNDDVELRRLLAPIEGELRAYAYRMLGSYHDAEDALQEARVKMWRGLAGLEDRARFRAWAYRVVSNVCLDDLRARRRVLPMDVGPATEPGPPTGEPRHDVPWLEPFPDAALPDATVAARQSLRLALLRAMQVLPPRQRAALILCDVLDWSAAEAAAILETTVPAIHSALQRARASLARPVDETPPAAAQAEAAARFVTAWETGQVDAFVAMLAKDAVLNMPPWVYWLDGRDAVAATMRDERTWGGPPRPGRYRIVVSAMNAGPAALAYVDFGDGRYRLVCTTVIGVDARGEVSDLTVFVLDDLFQSWGHPAVLDAP